MPPRCIVPHCGVTTDASVTEAIWDRIYTAAPPRQRQSVERVAALMAAQVAAEVEKQSGKPVMIDTAIMQRVLETHVRAQLEALADLRVSLA